MSKSISLLFFCMISISNAFGQGVGTKAPEFSLSSLEHGQITLSDYTGKVVYLFFFGFN